MKSKLKLYVMLKQAISPYSSQCVKAFTVKGRNKGTGRSPFRTCRTNQVQFTTLTATLYKLSEVRKQLEDKMNLKAESLKYFSL